MGNSGVRKAPKKVTSQRRPSLYEDLVSHEPELVSGKPPVVLSTTRQPVSTNIPNPIFEEKVVGDFEVETTFENAQKKKEDEIIAQIRKQLYEVLGQKRKQSKESSRSGNTPSITGNDISGILSNIGIPAPAPHILKKNKVPTKKVQIPFKPVKQEKRKKK